ncbi:tetratricopeptide repeat protein [Saccharospirillum impatiens]|uniref:tetratricopeptide repeat protein n=1 Tax=Saccharospirillum impatiens TaxID=169438 RepID=UPI000424FB22|nr:tetratricopeptide repeat protein [Saccharospirillum impatiens]
MLDRSAEILTLIQQGRLSPALARLKLWLSKDPNSAPAWHLLGIVQLHRSDYNAAEAALHQALQISPTDAYARNNRALVLLRLGRAEESRREAQAAIDRQPGEPGFLANLGYACEALRDYHDMADAFEQALALGADPQECGLAIAKARRQLTQWNKAREALAALSLTDPEVVTETLVLAHASGDRAAVARAEPLCQDDWDGIAAALVKAGQIEPAVDYYQRHLDDHPDDASARYLLEALTGQVAREANAAYVSSVFDNAAEQFDQHLLGPLDYQVPAWLTRQLPAWAPVNQVWDIGCGTGLAAGPVKQAYPAADLIGFDLSAAMLDQAKQKGHYRALHQLDVRDPQVFDALPADQQAPDLVLLMDVLIYVPDASRWLANAMTRVPEGCRWVITLEQGHHERIHKQGRIQHDGDALMAALPPHHCLHDELAPLRVEAGKTVVGRWLVLVSSPVAGAEHSHLTDSNSNA